MNTKYNKKIDPSKKDKITFDLEKNTNICPIGQIHKKEKSHKNKPRIAYWTKTVKYAQNIKNVIKIDIRQ